MKDPGRGGPLVTIDTEALLLRWEASARVQVSVKDSVALSGRVFAGITKYTNPLNPGINAPVVGVWAIAAMSNEESVLVQL